MKPTADQRMSVLVGLLGIAMLIRGLATAFYISFIPASVVFAIILAMKMLLPDVELIQAAQYWQALVAGMGVAILDSLCATVKK